MSETVELMSQIREFINNPRKRYVLLQDTIAWSKLTSAMDVVEDNELAIDFYLGTIHQPATDGEKYLLLYGILQVLFVQQDAVTHINEALNLKYSPSSSLKKIRDVRNDSIGHPSKRGNDKSFNYIIRMSMSRSGFNLLTSYADKKDDKFSSVNVISLIDEQREDLKRVLTNVVEILRQEEMKHRETFKDEKLEDAFPPVLGYYYEKIGEAIHGNKPSEFGSGIVSLIIKAIDDFKKLLEERGLLDVYDSIDYYLDLVEYPLNKLQEYFVDCENSKLNQKDAYIFLVFLQVNIDNIIDIAKEIDAEYETTP